MAVEYKDYYQLLGVSRSASKEEISKAYKKLARTYHPDLNQGDAKAEERFKDINEAHEVLKDDEKRRLYDQLGPDWQHGQQFQGAPGFEGFQFNFGGGQGGNFSSFFETLFGGGGGQGFGGDNPFGPFGGGGGGRPRARRGRDMTAEIAVTLEEALSGGTRQISLDGPDGPRTLEVKIPAGVKDGGKIRLAGQGYPGSPGAPSGDLFLIMRYTPHQFFQVEGDSLIYELLLAPWEAVLGAKVRVPTLEGSVEMNIPGGSGSGKKFRLRGKGLGPANARGDEIVRLAIRAPNPAHLTAKQKELWQALADEG